MKRLFILIATIAILYSCGDNNQRKAEKLITNYLKEHLDDWDSYEPVEFSELMPHTQKLDVKTEIDLLKDRQERYPNDGINYARKIDSLTMIYNTADSVTVCYYLITHTYRAANKFGGKERYYKWYKINADITEIRKYLE